MLSVVCTLIWLSQTVTQAADLDCGDRIDVIDVDAWPALQGFRQELINKTESVAVGLTKVNGQWAPQAVLHTKDKRTYLRGNSTYYHLYSCQGNTVTREIREIRGQAVKDIRFGYDYIVILTEEGSLYTAGINEFGQLGHHDKQNQKLFSKVEGLPSIKQIAVGAGSHCVVLTYNGQLWSWGVRDHYRLGYSANNKANPVPKSISIGQGIFTPVQVCCGWYACTVLMENYAVITWGRGGYNGRSSSDLLPGLVRGIPSNQKITQISCGWEHTLALSSTGKLFGWGNNAYGELLQAPSQHTSATELNTGGKIVRDVVAGTRITAIKTYSEEPEYFGWYNGQPRRTLTTTCSMENARDVLAKSCYGPETWGVVRLGCKLEDDETGAKMIVIDKKTGNVTIREDGEINMEAEQFRKLVKL